MYWRIHNHQIWQMIPIVPIVHYLIMFNDKILKWYNTMSNLSKQGFKKIAAVQRVQWYKKTSTILLSRFLKLPKMKIWPREITRNYFKICELVLKNRKKNILCNLHRYIGSVKRSVFVFIKSSFCSIKRATSEAMVFVKFVGRLFCKKCKSVFFFQKI